MGKHHLGEFEEIVLLTVAVLHGQAYGIAIIEEIENRMGRSVSMGAMQTVLRRMEQKGYLTSEFGEATAVRGGKRKRYFEVTESGKQAIRETKEARTALWEAIPNVVFKS